MVERGLKIGFLPQVMENHPRHATKRSNPWTWLVQFENGSTSDSHLGFAGFFCQSHIMLFHYFIPKLNHKNLVYLSLNVTGTTEGSRNIFLKVAVLLRIIYLTDLTCQTSAV